MLGGGRAENPISYLTTRVKVHVRQHGLFWQSACKAKIWAKFGLVWSVRTVRLHALTLLRRAVRSSKLLLLQSVGPWCTTAW